MSARGSITLGEAPRGKLTMLKKTPTGLGSVYCASGVRCLEGRREKLLAAAKPPIAIRDAGRAGAIGSFR
jgi:hypothetical protein